MSRGDLNCFVFPPEGVDVGADVRAGREKLPGVGVPGVVKELSSRRNAGRCGEELIGTLEADLNMFSDSSAGGLTNWESKDSESPSFHISFIFNRAFARAALDGASSPLFDAVENPMLGAGVDDTAVAFAV